MINVINVIKNNRTDIIKLGIIGVLVLLAVYFRYQVFDEAGGDFETYRLAVVTYLNGGNPYKWTVESYSDPDAVDTNHGYAYMPTLLYIYTPIYDLFHLKMHYPPQRLWKIIIMVADLGIGFLLTLNFWKKGRIDRNFIMLIFSLVVWYWHPFFMVRHSYTNTEPLSMFFVLLALYFLEKNDYLSGLSFATAISFKIFPAIFLPIFLIKSKNKLKFLAAGLLFAILISIPFMKSTKDFMYYVQGALLVHSEREIQGRPLLSFVEYYTKVQFYQNEYTKLYTWLALLTAWGLSLFLYFYKKVKDKYILALSSFGAFFLFTPVLARTYLIWCIPVLLISVFRIDSLKKKNYWAAYLVVLIFYAFYCWYLSQWTRGFRVVDHQITL